MTQAQNNQMYDKVRVTLDLAPANSMIKDAMLNMMINYPDAWKALVYEQLLAGDPRRTQSFLVGSNEDMIQMLLLTARYQTVSSDEIYALFVTDDFGVGSGVAPTARCSNDSLFRVDMEEDEDRNQIYYCKMEVGTCYPYPDYEVAIGLKKDTTDNWVIDMVVSNNWITGSLVHPKVTIKTKEDFISHMKIKDLDPATLKSHLFSKEDLMAMGITGVDVTTAS